MTNTVRNRAAVHLVLGAMVLGALTFASAAFAQNADPAGWHGSAATGDDPAPGVRHERRPIHPKLPPGEDRPVAPAPEPGTMALGAMGLLSLAGIARNRFKR